MAVAVSILPSKQLAVLNDAYRKAVARKRLRLALATAVFFAGLVVAAVGAEVNLRTFFTYFGNFISYFDRILTLDDGTRVWTNFGEWFWGWRKWLWMLGETILISYVGTLFGRAGLFAQLLRRRKHLASALAAFRRPPPAGIRAYRSWHRVRADLCHRIRSRADGGRAGDSDPLHRRARQVVFRDRRKCRHETGRGCALHRRELALLHALRGDAAGHRRLASYALLRFEINVREASVMGFVGAGGIGQELVVAIRKFYYSDVSAILLTIIVTVFVIDIGTGWMRGRLFGKDART